MGNMVFNQEMMLKWWFSGVQSAKTVFFNGF